MPPRSSVRKRTHKNKADKKSGQQQNADQTIEDIKPGMLAREPDPSNKSASGFMGRTLWILAGCAVMIATLGVFFVIDRKTSQDIIEQGREAIRDAPPSDFMPSASEIRRSESRGAFVQPTK